MDTKNLYGDSGVNGWFPMLEEYIRSIADECSRFATKHANASKQFNKYYQMITIGLIVLPLLSGSIGLLPITETTLRILSTISNLIQAAIAGLNKTMQFSEQAYVHRKASDKYSDLHSSVSEQLLFPFDIRDNGVLFARWSRRQFFKLRALTPFPDRKIGKHKDLESQTSSSPVPIEPVDNSEQVMIDPATGEPTTSLLDSDNTNESERARRRNENYKNFYANRPQVPVVFKSTHDT